MSARLCLVFAAVTAAGCLPKENSREYPCSTTAQCATNWECVDGTCRQGCVGAGDCTTPDWAGTPYACQQGHCIPRTDGSSGGVSSGAGSSGLSTSSSEGASSGTSSGSSADSGSSGSSGSSGPSGSSSSGGGSGYRHDIFTITGGGGLAPGNFKKMQLSVGQPLASTPARGASGARMSLGVFSTVGVP
jgi:hypothetical protein